MRLLTQDELQEMLVVYAKQKRLVPSYRFGQSIYNQLFEKAQDSGPKLVTLTVVKEGRPDFFYWTDEGAVMTELLEHYVEDAI